MASIGSIVKSARLYSAGDEIFEVTARHEPTGHVQTPQLGRIRVLSGGICYSLLSGRCPNSEIITPSRQSLGTFSLFQTSRNSQSFCRCSAVLTGFTAHLGSFGVIPSFPPGRPFFSFLTAAWTSASAGASASGNFYCRTRQL